MGDISNGTRILLIQYLLKRLTDNNHALSRDELIDRISLISASVSGNTIKSDIESIKVFDHLINESHDVLIQPYKSYRGGKIDYVTKQKKGSFVAKPFYNDVWLIVLSRLLKKINFVENATEPKLIEKVLADSSIHRINHYHLFDDDKKDDSTIFCYLQLIVDAINEYSCLDFKVQEYSIINNEIVDIVSQQSILLYPTNIDIIDDDLYLVGYQFTKDEDIELKYYLVERICELKMCYCPKSIQQKMEPFKDRIWQDNDPLNIDSKNKINLELRLYPGNNQIFGKLRHKFNGHVIDIEQFHQFVEVAIKNVTNDNSLSEWFLQMSNNIEVIKPIELREKIKDRIMRMQMIYRL